MDCITIYSFIKDQEADSVQLQHGEVVRGRLQEPQCHRDRHQGERLALMQPKRCNCTRVLNQTRHLFFSSEFGQN